MTAYITATEANAILDPVMNTNSWDSKTSTQKDKALETATRAMDRLLFTGAKTVSTQELEFPRDEELTVPDAIQKACAYEALELLGGKSPEKEWENLDLKSRGYANVRSNYNINYRADNINSGIMSVLAWRYLLPYLGDPNEIDILKEI